VSSSRVIATRTRPEAARASRIARADRQGHVLLRPAATKGEVGARILAAMARIDDDERRIGGAGRGHMRQRPELVGAQRAQRNVDAGRAAPRRAAGQDRVGEARPEQGQQQGQQPIHRPWFCRAPAAPVQRKFGRRNGRGGCPPRLAVLAACHRT
jgi:hypothetical protein